MFSLKPSPICFQNLDLKLAVYRNVCRSRSFDTLRFHFIDFPSVGRGIRHAHLHVGYRMDLNLEANEMETKEHLAVTLVGIAAIGVFVGLLCAAHVPARTEHSGHRDVVSGITSANGREFGQSHSSLHSDKPGYLRH